MEREVWRVVSTQSGGGKEKHREENSLLRLEEEINTEEQRDRETQRKIFWLGFIKDSNYEMYLRHRGSRRERQRIAEENIKRGDRLNDHLFLLSEFYIDTGEEICSCHGIIKILGDGLCAIDITESIPVGFV